MKYLLPCLLVMAPPALADDTTIPMTPAVASPPPAAASAPATNTAAPQPPASPATQAWDKLSDDFKALQATGGTDADMMQGRITALLYEAHDFFTKYPDDPRCVGAAALWGQLAGTMTRQGWSRAPSAADMIQAYDKIAANSKLPQKGRAQLRVMEVALSMHMAAAADDPKLWDGVEDRFAQFDKDFGPDFSFDGKMPVMAQLRAEQIQEMAPTSDQARYTALLAKLAASSNPQLAALAKRTQDQQKHMADLKTKPLDLKYTAVDGSAVDLSKLRGKVVLVDFWATWCPPCRQEVPDVVAAYKKYHDKGFEVVGVSLDQDKDKLLAYTKDNGMVWPQYFDGKGWDNDISKGFGINSIPAMWLVGKDGMLVTMNGRDNLDGQIGKLLAAPTASP